MSKSKYVLPLHSYYRDLQKQVDEAEWLGEDVDWMEHELDNVKQRLENGEVWETTF